MSNDNNLKINSSSLHLLETNSKISQYYFNFILINNYYSTKLDSNKNNNKRTEKKNMFLLRI